MMNHLYSTKGENSEKQNIQPNNPIIDHTAQPFRPPLGLLLNIPLYDFEPVK